MKKTKMQKGITLIALIITIVVLLILAVVTINAVKDGGIISNAQKAANDYTIAQEKEQIGLGYSEYIINKNISEDAALEVEGASVTGNETNGWTIIFSKTGNEYTLSSNGVIEKVVPEEDGSEVDEPVVDGPEPIIHGGVIPEDGTYKRIAEDGTETQFVAGQAFPETVLDGDIYIYEDYEYRYNCVWFENWMDITTANQTMSLELSNGWGVRVIDATKTQYSAMLSTINGVNVTNVLYTYAICTNLEKTPQLSNETKDMSFAFFYCTSLTIVSDLPNSVVNMSNTFDNCVALTSLAPIPSSVINMQRTFANCSSLVTPPDISNAVNIDNMSETFDGCELLSGKIEINANPTIYEHCFHSVKGTIKITGAASDSTKEALAKTSTEVTGNVTWE